MTDWSLSLLPSGDRWGARRRLFQEVMNGRLTRNFDSHHLKYVHRFLSRLLEAPESFMQEAELCVVSYHPCAQTVCLHIAQPPKRPWSRYHVHNIRD